MNNKNNDSLDWSRLRKIINEANLENKEIAAYAPTEQKFEPIGAFSCGVEPFISVKNKLSEVNFDSEYHLPDLMMPDGTDLDLKTSRVLWDSRGASCGKSAVWRQIYYKKDK